MAMYGTVLVATLAGALLLGCTAEGPDVTPSVAVNLAGCPIPAGIEWEEAEAVQCGTLSAGTPKSETAENGGTPLRADEDVINVALAEDAGRSERASEYREARRMAEGDLTGDGEPELVVLFTLEGGGGGNGVEGYLAAFQRDARGQLSAADTILVTGYGGSAQDVRITSGAAVVKLLVQGPDDPACCPSENMEQRYVLHLGRWLQVQS